MRRILYVLILLGLLASLGAAAEPALLPDHFGNWQADGPARTYTAKDYFQAHLQPPIVGGEILSESHRACGGQSRAKPGPGYGNIQYYLHLLIFQKAPRHRGAG